MFYADLTELPSPGDLQDLSYKKRKLAIGWLDKEHTYTQGDVSDQFTERLWVFCRMPYAVTMGIHDCEFCQDASSDLIIQRGEETFRPGSGVILVFENRDLAYSAPDLIYHYVTDHRYLPPEVFIKAVLNCPFPYLTEHHEFIRQFEGNPEQVSIFDKFKKWFGRKP